MRKFLFILPIIVLVGAGCQPAAKLSDKTDRTPETTVASDQTSTENLAVNISIEDNYTLIWENDVLVDGQTLKNTLFDTYAKENGFINLKTGRKQGLDDMLEVATAFVKQGQIHIYLLATWECEDCKRLLPTYLVFDTATKKISYQQMNKIANPHLFASESYLTLSPNTRAVAYLEIEKYTMKETVWVYDFIKGTSQKIQELPEGQTVRGCWPDLCADGEQGGELYWENSGELIVVPAKNHI